MREKQKQFGLFPSPYLSLSQHQKIVDQLGPQRVQNTPRLPQTAKEYETFPQYLLVAGGDGTNRHALRWIYAMRRFANVREAPAIILAGSFGNMNKGALLLNSHGLVVLASELIRGEDKLASFPRFHPGLIDDEPFALDCSLGRLEANIWDSDIRVLGKLREPLRKILGLGRTLGDLDGAETPIFNTFVTNPIIGPRGVIEEQRFLGDKLTQVTIDNESWLSEKIRLVTALKQMQGGRRPDYLTLITNFADIEVAKIRTSPSFIMPNCPGQKVALDGDLVTLPVKDQGTRTIRRTDWSVSIALLTDRHLELFRG